MRRTEDVILISRLVQTCFTSFSHMRGLVYRPIAIEAVAGSGEDCATATRGKYELALITALCSQ